MIINKQILMIMNKQILMIINKQNTNDDKLKK